MGRLNKSGIDYLDYGWNFYSGCDNWRNGVCKVGKRCWAKQRTHRFKDVYPNGFEPTFYWDSFLEPLKLLDKPPARIGVAFMGDLFTQDPNMPLDFECKSVGQIITVDGKPAMVSAYGETLKSAIFKVIEQLPQHTFVFLTKVYWNLPKWGKFPDNCAVGLSDTDCKEDLSIMSQVQAKKKFVSYEPLYNFSHPDLRWVDGIVLGGQTRPTLMPRLEWILELVEDADKLQKKVFLKNNLLDFISGLDITCPKMESRILNTLYEGDNLRQEFV
jgi:hypothetical protein